MRLDAVEATQAGLREEVAKLTAAGSTATAADLMMVGKAVEKLTIRVGIIERDVRHLNKRLAYDTCEFNERLVKIAG